MRIQMDSPPDWHLLRAEFPALASWTYLNTATYGQTPRRSVAAMAAHFERRARLACSDFLEWFDDVDEIRERIGRLLNCSGSDIAFAPSAAAALSLFLGGIEWRDGDRIVTLRDEFPNQVYYAKWLSARGVELIEMAEIQDLPLRTRAVVASTVSYIQYSSLNPFSANRCSRSAIFGNPARQPLQLAFYKLQKCV